MDKNNNLLSFEDFQNLFNKRLFDGSRLKLLENIAKYPDRFLGLFRPTKPKTKRGFIWNEVICHLSLWKETLPDMPEINFDIESKEVLKELLHIKPSVLRALFENEHIKLQILPILFPLGVTLKELAKIFSSKPEPIYVYLTTQIEQFLENTI